MFIIELIVNICYLILALVIPGKVSLLNSETTRKISHVLCGNWIFIFSFFNKFFLTNILVMILMILLMIFSYKYNIFKGIERTNQVKSYGTVYFFISLLLLVIIVEINNLNKSAIIIYFFPLIYGDAIAALVGKKYNWIEYKIFNNKKTVSGNIGMFLTSFLTMILYKSIFLNDIYSFYNIFIISIVACILEAISIKGTDNITIPILTMFICEVII